MVMLREHEMGVYLDSLIRILKTKGIKLLSKKVAFDCNVTTVISTCIFSYDSNIDDGSNIRNIFGISFFQEG